MKKQNIIIISIVVVIVIVGIVCTFLFKGKSSTEENNFNPQEQNQNVEESSIASLLVGNWVSVVAEKSNGSYTASMIMACDSKGTCSNQEKTPPSGGTAPTGEAPTGALPSGADKAPSGVAPTGKRSTNNMENKTMLSGTITEVNTDNIVLTLDTGETAKVLISTSTRINKK